MGIALDPKTYPQLLQKQYDGKLEIRSMALRAPFFVICI